MFLARFVKSLQCLPVCLNDGRILNLDLREVQNMPYLFTGRIPYEDTEDLLIRSIVQPGEVVLDIGANVGWYSTLLGEVVGPGGRVYAFEPNARLVKVLEQTSNRYPQLYVNAVGLSDREKEADLNIPSHLGGASLRDIPGTLTRQKCRLTTFANFIKSIGNPTLSFVKCDVEGAELEVLYGAASYLKTQSAPIWMIEVNAEASTRFGYGPQDLVDFFEQLGIGYTGYRIDSQTGELLPLYPLTNSIFNAIFVPPAYESRIKAYSNSLAISERKMRPKGSPDSQAEPESNHADYQPDAEERRRWPDGQLVKAEHASAPNNSNDRSQIARFQKSYSKKQH